MRDEENALMTGGHLVDEVAELFTQTDRDKNIEIGKYLFVATRLCADKTFLHPRNIYEKLLDWESVPHDEGITGALVSTIRYLLVEHLFAEVGFSEDRCFHAMDFYDGDIARSELLFTYHELKNAENKGIPRPVHVQSAYVATQLAGRFILGEP